MKQGLPWKYKSCFSNPALFKAVFDQRTARGASGKGPRQKSSKSVKNIFDAFRHFSRRAKNVKNRQKVSKIFFDNFRAAPVFRPLLGCSDLRLWNQYFFVVLLWPSSNEKAIFASVEPMNLSRLLVSRHLRECLGELCSFFEVPGTITQRTLSFTIAVVIRYLWRFPVKFLWKTRCFRDPAVVLC